MPEDNTQVSNENIEQNVQTAESDESVDYKSLYLHEVQNAKKLRKRSQDNEKKLSSFEQKAEEQRISQLKENDKYKELSDELQAKLDTVNPYKEKWETHESQKRESLLSKVPEADREFLKEKDIQTLEYIVSKQENLKNNVTVNANSSRGVTGKPIKNFADKDNDLKGSWSAILDSYKN
jgi:hypothetical protein